ncbi:hypothetical protein [Peribacillus muralis]|nr:hypothetical protein [Peribacillus muralis]
MKCSNGNGRKLKNRTGSDSDMTGNENEVGWIKGKPDRQMAVSLLGDE